MNKADRPLSTVRRIGEFGLDLLFPPVCVGCNELTADGHSKYLCRECFESIKLSNGQICAFCQSPTIDGRTCPFCRRDNLLHSLTVAASYDQTTVRNSIKAFKYRFIRGLSRDLAQLMLDYLRTRKLGFSGHTVVPVPLSTRRLRWRGFNQAQLLAGYLSTWLDLPLVQPLQRVRHTQPQAEIESRNDRMSNIIGAFVCHDPALVSGRKVLLIDDVSTTCSTLEECAKTLRTAGATSVSAFVFARNN